MEIRIDNQPSSPLADEPRDVLAAVAAVSDYLRTRGRAVMSVRIDGRTVAADALAATLRDKPVADVNVLEIASEDIIGLVNNSLSELELVLPDLPDVCRRLAELFQSQDPNSGYEPFNQLAAIWKTVKERQVLIAGALDIDLNAEVVNGKRVADHHAEFNRLLGEAAEAIQSGDSVTLGDLLEHEMAPKAEAEARIVALLRARARGERG